MLIMLTIIAVIRTIIIMTTREIHSHQEEKMIMKGQIIQTKTFLQIVVDEAVKRNPFLLGVIKYNN